MPGLKPPLTLLLDPRGAIGRGAFWAGLGLLSAVLLAALVSILVLNLWLPAGEAAAALTPVVGTSYLASSIVEAVKDRHTSLMLIPLALLACARFYPLTCLCVKRLRDAGRGPAWLIVVSALSLAFHVQMGRWTYDLWASEIGQLVPGLVDTVFNTLLWTGFLIWIGASRSRPRQNAGSNRLQVKPAS
jgi:uncharacterized membrane protein YhaH (DUF805 family)